MIKSTKQILRPTLTIERRDFYPDGTLGVLLIEGRLTGIYTVELPWKNNEANISCIPQGIYYAHKHYSENLDEEVFWIHDVPNREYIYIHTANTINDIKGCVGIGDSLVELEEKPGVGNSKDTKDYLLSLLPEVVTIEIKNAS